MKWRNLLKPDIWKALILVAVLIGGLTAVTRCAEAGEWFPNHPRVYMGAVHEARVSVAPECRDSRWVGEAGVEHDLYEAGRSRFEIAYRHHSCLDEQDDAATMDGIGIRWVWTIR